MVLWLTPSLTFLVCFMISKPDIALKEATTDQIVNRLILDMLQRFHTRGLNSQLDKRIEQAWLLHRGTAFFSREVTPTYLRGYPGQGKTTSFKVAAKQVAMTLELEWVENPADDYLPTGNELLFVVQELSGQVSSVDFGGIPNVKTFPTVSGGEQAYMTKLANKRLTALQHAGAAVLLLDDFSNASPNIQNVALSILTENRFQGLDLGNTLVGATGNLGTADGTHVSSTSNAVVTRVANFLVVDTVEHWVARTCQQYGDSIGDGGVAGFLYRHKDLFHTPKRARDGVPYPCPRSWSLFLPKLREILFSYYEKRKAFSEEPFPFDELEFEAAGLLGLEVAQRLASYYLSRIQLSDPLAKRVVTMGRFSDEDREIFRKHYAGGFAANSQQFGFQYMTALADYAAQALVDHLSDKSQWDFIVNGLAEGLYSERTDHALLSYAASYFALRVILLSDSHADIGQIDRKGKPRLKDSLVEQLALAMANMPIAREIVERAEHGRAVRLMDETFCQVVSLYTGYGEEVQ